MDDRCRGGACLANHHRRSRHDHHHRHRDDQPGKKIHPSRASSWFPPSPPRSGSPSQTGPRLG